MLLGAKTPTAIEIQTSQSTDPKAARTRKQILQVGHRE